MIEIKAPQFPESIADGEVATWHVDIGEQVRRDQVLVDIETDKVVLEVVAPSDGTLTAIYKREGSTVMAEEILGDFEHEVSHDETPSSSKRSSATESVLESVELATIPREET